MDDLPFDFIRLIVADLENRLTEVALIDVLRAVAYLSEEFDFGFPRLGSYIMPASERSLKFLQ